MARDIDPADVAEVRRRVIDPVIGAMLHPGELTTLSVQIDLAEASWWEFESYEDEPQVWLRLAVRDEDFEHRVCKPGFWLDDPAWIAATLEDQLNEWICETRFGWGQLRSGPELGALPGPPVVASGRAVSIHLHDAGGLPVWEGGYSADPGSLPVSGGLHRELLAWQERAEQLADAAEAARSTAEPPAADPVGIWVEYVTERSALSQQVAADRRRAHAAAAWNAWVDELQTARDVLVIRLREELGPTFVVLEPPRLPRLS